MGGYLGYYGKLQHSPSLLGLWGDPEYHRVLSNVFQETFVSNLLVQREKKSFASHSWSGEVSEWVSVHEHEQVCVMRVCMHVSNYTL